MLLKTRGIVLRSFKYSETSLITEIYTEAKGLKKYVVSGVRKKKAKVSAGLFQVMSIVDLVAYDREDRELNRIKEIKPAYLYQRLPFNVVRSSVGLFIVELSQKCLRQSEQNEELFQFLYQSFVWLDESPHSVANIHLYFLLKFSDFLGFAPSGECCSDTPFFDLQEGYFVPHQPLKHSLDESMSHLMDAFCQTSIFEAHLVSLNRVQRHSFLESLIEYYRLHIDNFPTVQAHQILKEVLGS